MSIWKDYAFLAKLLYAKIDQESHNVDEKRQSEVNTEMNLMLEISDKAFKVVVIEMLQFLFNKGIANAFETNET